MSRFRHFIAIDWSGAKGERHRSIALATCSLGDDAPTLAAPPAKGWSREDVLHLLKHDLPHSTLVGLDLGTSLAFADCGAFFPGWSRSPPDAKALWRLVEECCAEDDHLAASSFVAHPELREYFHHGAQMGTHYRCDGAEHRNGRLRITEHAQRAVGCRPHSNFKLVGNGQVGKASLTGMRVLHRLAGTLPVWPFDADPGTGSLVVEMYTAIPALAVGGKASATKIRSYEDLNKALTHPAIGSRPVAGAGPISDHASDALLTAAWLRRAASREELWRPVGLTEEIARTEGWTFGVT